MVLTDEQVNEIKQRLMGQLDNFPEDKRDQIKNQILALTNEQLEQFVQQNNLGHLENGDDCVFCNIVQGKIPSVKIYEDDENSAILELNPLSRGHTLVVPKGHPDSISDSTKGLAGKISEKIKSILNPKKVQVREGKIMGHALLEVIPLYDLEFPKDRKQATQEELVQLQKELVEDKTPEPPKEELSAKCNLCSIANGEIPSKKIEENKSNVAVLDITPLTKGHTLVIPKEHVGITKIPSSAFTLAKKISGKMKTRLKPIDIRISTTENNGHAFIEVIPLYSEEAPQRYRAKEEELEKMKKKLEVKRKAKKSKTKGKKNNSRGGPKYPDLPQVKPRIP